MRAKVFPCKDAMVRLALGAEPREPGNFAPLLRQIFTDRLTLIDVTPKGGLAIRGAAAVDRPVVSEIDLKTMERCVELSRTVRRYGEFPFASLVCKGEVVVSEEISQVDRNGDVTRQAELMGVCEAQRVLGRNVRTARHRRFNWHQIAHMMIFGCRTSEFLPRGGVFSAQGRSNARGQPAPVAVVGPGSRAVD
jgi:hypothetical protein